MSLTVALVAIGTILFIGATGALMARAVILLVHLLLEFIGIVGILLVAGVLWWNSRR